MLLIDDLCGKAELGDDVLLFGVAGEGVVFCGNIKAIEGLDIAIIIFNMQAVGLQGHSVDVIFFAAVFTLEDEAVFGVVCDFCGSEMLKTPATGHGVDVNVVFKGIGAVFDLFFHLFTFPGEPIRHVAEFRIAIVCFQCSVLAESPALAAFFAEDLGALGGHFGFCHAMRALIQDFMHTFRTIRLGDEDAVFLLVAIIVVCERFSDCGCDLICRHFFDLLCGQNLRHCSMEGDFSLFSEIPEG